jgi:hypothetical protein
MARDPNGLFEDERDADGQLVLSEIGLRFKEITEDAMARQVDARIDELVKTVDQYFELEVMPAIEEDVESSVAELRKLMLLAVAQIGGQDKAREFVRKIAELARAGALSSASGAWAQASPNEAGSNHDSLTPNSRPARYEEVEPLTEGYVRAISRTVRH